MSLIMGSTMPIISSTVVYSTTTGPTVSLPQNVVSQSSPTRSNIQGKGLVRPHLTCLFHNICIKAMVETINMACLLEGK
jgi:hypothetical protein